VNGGVKKYFAQLSCLDFPAFLNAIEPIALNTEKKMFFFTEHIDIQAT